VWAALSLVFARGVLMVAIVGAVCRERNGGPTGGRGAGLSLGVTGLVLVASVGLMGWRRDPGPRAGVTYMLTWGMLGLIGLGAVFRRGWARSSYLGASLFDVGYMILIFGWFPDWAFRPAPRSTSSCARQLGTGDPRIDSVTYYAVKH
jgi:hypothetical protein